MTHTETMNRHNSDRLSRIQREKLLFAREGEWMGRGVQCFFLGVATLLIFQNIYVVVVLALAPGLFYLAAVATGRMHMNAFEWFRNVEDLDQRHVALLNFLKLKERLVPRHWEVVKADAEK